MCESKLLHLGVEKFLDEFSCVAGGKSIALVNTYTRQENLSRLLLFFFFFHGPKGPRPLLTFVHDGETALCTSPLLHHCCIFKRRRV